MYQCIIPPRIWLSVGLSLLIFGLVLGWISLAVPDWLQYYENNNLNQESSNDLRKFGLWNNCTFNTRLNDYDCTSWNGNAPSFVRVTQSLIPIGLILGTVSLLAACIGFTSRKAFNASVLFAGLFSFLCFVFTIIGLTVFATESLAFIERMHTNLNSRRYGMWLMIPCLTFSFLAALCFIVAAILNWYDYKSMKVTGILNHSTDKFGSVFKAPSESNMTAFKHQQLAQTKPIMPAHQYPEACYQLGAVPGYPPPPSYAPQLNGAINPAFHCGLYGYSRPPSPSTNFLYNPDLYHHRHYITENSDLEDVPKNSRSRKRSQSRRHSGHRSRSHSPRENNNNGHNQNQPQYIPIPIPYYQPQPQHPAPSANGTAQQLPQMPYVIQTSNQNQPTQYIEELVQTIPQSRIITEAKGNVLTYPVLTNGSLLMNTNPIQLTGGGQTQQPVYAISYRTNNSSIIPSNGQQIAITTGPPATSYVTTAANPSRGPYMYSQANTDQIFEITSDDDENMMQQTQQKLATIPRRNDQNKSIKEAWTWRKL
ncbi:unnamed protein product [Didymodactylos carnosus]|uniref:Uncharacterized protein n=1 Tax=Didymodactylos carnosus TaxID=1234261 RepID=A0A814Q118_9BILA|nr:unnamed protein product [Didymodactylos carnosus]CAF1113780.1 unnamed protein product [Didymodactylos carnosus]CAF3816115.1 unnamed protein product [Didymodactylos carnosus]CAF3877882.1 unnamed protein product [Didymodactylos carnosus]